MLGLVDLPRKENKEQEKEKKAELGDWEDVMGKKQDYSFQQQHRPMLNENGTVPRATLH